jgi:hypothetical protein
MQRYARANEPQLTRFLTNTVLGLAGLRSPESVIVLLIECLPQQMRTAEVSCLGPVEPKTEIIL